MAPLRQDVRLEVLEALGEYAAERSSALIAELDDRGTIVAVNAALAAQAGGELIGTDVHRLFSPAQHHALDRALSAASAEGWQDRILGLFPDAHGVPSDFSVSLRRLGHGWLVVAVPARSEVTEVNGRLLALNDELAHMQRQINAQNAELSRHNERLRELDQLKDELLANVSHDLRTPLTAILGYAELMRRRGGLSDKQDAAAEIIERNARRLLRLVEDLLLLAQARAGQLRLEREPVDLAVLAADAADLTRPLAEQGGLELTLEIPRSGVAVVQGDRLRLGQLLVNLAANAIKYTPAGGHVCVRVRSGETSACLEVQDDGPGIPQEHQARLYDAFVRGPRAQGPGTGLGLAIVREVATAHDATIELVSRPDRGTCFTVRLPRESTSLPPT